jgi:hypothetical protein
MTYLLDTNVFIQAKQLHYGFDFCPAFWQWVLEQGAAGQVFSIDKVADELDAIADDLSAWAKADAAELFRPTDARIVDQFGAVSAWVMSQSYEPAAVSTFLQVADFYLIAHALAEGCVLVTHEDPANSVKKIKIPNVCAGLSIKFMTPYGMLRRERARFVLGPEVRAS